ncbi:MAG: response regulator [Solirubrobacteraceae bacterium]
MTAAADILIVEDSADNRRLLTIILSAEGHRVREATNVEEALAMARSQRPDLVISDLLMPGGADGFDLARHMRSDPSLAHVHGVLHRVLSRRRGA